MMDKKLEELLLMYGYEIRYAEPGEGGIFYQDAEGKEVRLDYEFVPNKFSVHECENVSLEQCNDYSRYSKMAELMIDAA